MAQGGDTKKALQDLADRLADIARSLDSAGRGDLQEVIVEIIGVRDRLFGPPPQSPRGEGAKGKILAYFQAHVGEEVTGSQLSEVSGIQEWARRVRELRVEDGWQIEELGGSRYVLRTLERDEGSADRWALMNGIRSQGGSATDRIMTFLEATVGEVVTRDEVDYVGKVKEGIRRLREIRDERGWPIESHIDDPALAPGQYRLVSTDPADRRDSGQRQYPENLRERVFRRDSYTCQACGRDRESAEAAGDRRFFLEVHHKVAIADDLAALTIEDRHKIDNLTTLCHRDHVAETARLQDQKRKTRGS
jgi:hypothetical protein